MVNEKEERYSVGTTARFPKSYPKKCIFCKHDTFFTNKWDWKVQKPVCMNCALENNMIDPDSIIITRETEEETKNLLNLTDQEMEMVITDFKKKLKRGELPEQKGT